MADRNLAHLTEQQRQEAFSARSPQGRIGDVEDIAKAVAFLTSNDSGYINGATLVIDGGAAAGFMMHR